MSEGVQLIVNADDFGLTRGVNRAIIELHEAGVVTSATLMAHGAAFDHAVELALAHPELGVGCHIVLTDGVPVSPPHTIPTLLGSDRRSFRPSLRDFLLAAVTHRVRLEEIEHEAVAQIETLQRAGIAVTHLDTHKHTHVGPPIAAALLRAAQRTGVPAIRNPFEGNWSLRIGQTRRLRLLAVTATRLFRHRFLAQPAIRSGRIRTSQGTVGISATGRLDEGILRQIVAALPAGTWELVCHPGYNDRDLDAVPTRLRYTREIEREALLAVLSETSFAGQSAAYPHRLRPELIHYGRL